MAKLTIFFGLILVVISGIAYAGLGQGSHGIHALIPGLFGLLLVISGVLANTPDSKRRMIFMHIAVTVGLLGFLGTMPGLIAVVRRGLGQVVGFPAPDAARVQAEMGTVCLVFVVLCVRSFIAARRARTAA